MDEVFLRTGRTAGITALAIIATASGASIARADLFVTNVQMDAKSQIADIFPNGLVDAKTTKAPFSLGKKIETFVTTKGVHFPTRSAPADPFASATASANLEYAVGVSGLKGGFFQAHAETELKFTNFGPDPIDFSIGWHIPDSQVLLHTQPGLDTNTAKILAGANYIWSFDTHSGRQTTDPITIYDYQLEVSTPNGIPEFHASKDLLDAALDGLTAIAAVDMPAPPFPSPTGGTSQYGRIVGRTFTGFDTHWDLGTFDSGDEWTMKFFGNAFYDSYPEYGAQAQIGDPLEFLTGAGFTYTATPATTPTQPPGPGPSPVPLPAAAWLMGAGVFSLASLGRRREA